jgi:hypothetical protein
MSVFYLLVPIPSENRRDTGLVLTKDDAADTMQRGVTNANAVRPFSNELAASSWGV